MRSTLSGTTPFSVIGLVFGVAASAFVASILLSPGGWQWWLDTKTVHGMERDGIVYYSYRGGNYTVDDQGSDRTGPRTVYLIPSQPSNAVLSETPTQVLDLGLTGGLYLVGCGFVAAGFLRRRRTMHDDRRGSFGRGLDHATIERLLAEQRARHAPRPSKSSDDDPHYPQAQ